VLTLINEMIVKAPTEKKICKFVARMENLGVFEELKSLGKEKHPEIIN
jgi:hypothetical protein